MLISWSQQEELVLIKVWVEISEELAKGNAQPADHFWIRVLDRFHKELGKEDEEIVPNTNLIQSIKK